MYVRFIGERVDDSFSKNFAPFLNSPLTFHLQCNRNDPANIQLCHLSTYRLSRFFFCFSVKGPRKMGFKYPHATCSMVIFLETPSKMAKFDSSLFILTLLISRMFMFIHMVLGLW